MGARVFSYEPQDKFDLGNAEGFGQIVYLYKNKEARPNLFSKAFVDDVLDRLEISEFNPDKDYFLIVGGLTPLVLIASIMAKEYRDIKLLVFNMVARLYEKVVI